MFVFCPKSELRIKNFYLKIFLFFCSSALRTTISDPLLFYVYGSGKEVVYSNKVENLQFFEYQFSGTIYHPCIGKYFYSICSLIASTFY